MQDLLLGGRNITAVVDHNGGAATLFVQGHLGIDPRVGCICSDTLPAHQPFELDRHGRIYDNDVGKTVCHPGLQQQGNVLNNHCIVRAMSQFSHFAIDLNTYLGVYDLFQLFSQVWILEHHLP